MENLSDLPYELQKEFAQNIRKILNWTGFQARNLWDNTVREYEQRKQELPPLMKFLHPVLGDYDFKLTLTYNRFFCKESGLPYSTVDEYWDYIRAGAAEIYYNQKIREDKFIN
jgi:hypothetical protein